jgi:hypothetical protein
MMAALPMSKAVPLTFERASEIVTYCPATGALTWRKTRPGCVAGQVVGTLTDGYLQIQIDLVFYKVHRIAWLLAYGRWPVGFIDHINRNRSDNRLENLREATPQQNARNRSPGPLNPSGVPGVFWDKRRRRWVACIGLHGRSRHLGAFKILDDAIAVRIDAERTHYGEFARSAGGANV